MSSVLRPKRWCPTPEQLMILEELYRRGITNPNSVQVQKITTRLSYYGRVHGKNVFYWFQNHKARERQKLRKKQHVNQEQNYPPQEQAYPYFLYFQNPSSLQCNTSASNESTGNNHPQDRIEHETDLSHQKSTCWMYQFTPFTSLDDNKTLENVEDHWSIGGGGPTICYRERPVETLELFPLRSSSDKTQGL